MKRTIGTALLSVILTLGVLSIMGQGRDDWRYGGRINGKVSVRDSLTVEKAVKLSVAVGSRVGFKTGTRAVDTLVVSGVLKTTSQVFLMPITNSTGIDTANSPKLLVKSVKADTAFLLQGVGTANIDTVAYNYAIFN